MELLGDSFLNEAFENLPDAVVVFDRDRRVRASNRAARVLTGTEGQEIVGHRLDELVERLGQFRENQQMLTILDVVIGEVMERGEEHHDDDSSRRGPDGTSVPVSFRLTPIRRGGEVVGVMLIIRDLGDDNSLMFRRAAVGMTHIDRTGMVRETNAAFLTFLGLEEHTLLRQPFLDLVHPDDTELAEGALHRVLSGAETDSRAAVRFLHTDGTLRWADVSVAWNGMGGAGSGGACAIVQDVTERVLLQAELEQAHLRMGELALHDPLTGLANRAQLSERLDEAQLAARASGGHVAVLFVDLDDFKRVNDSAGHATGDHLLVEVADRLRSVLRPGDTAARLGGDEFVICCPGLDGDIVHALVQSRRIAGRVDDALRRPFSTTGRVWQLSGSVGIAVSRSGRELPEDLLRRADLEMYRMKGSRAG